jgi:hypothetical protein|tara:strand:- start:479 stop:631 length:153 start_codon:yes stop_codon:yes gene_type:complete
MAYRESFSNTIDFRVMEKGWGTVVRGDTLIFALMLDALIARLTGLLGYRV